NQEGTYCFDLGTGQLKWQNKEYMPGSLVESPGGRVYPDRMHFPILDAASGEAVAMPPADWYEKMILLPDGKTLLSSDGHVLGDAVWDLAAMKQVRKIDGAKGPIAVSADGKTLASSSGRLECWEVATGQALFPDNSDQGHVGEAVALAFGADGRRL